MLIGFGVVILPALLGGADPDFGQEEAQVTPRLDSKVFVSKITPIGGPTPQRLPEPVQNAQPVPEKPAPTQSAPTNTGSPKKQVARAADATIAKPKPVSTVGTDQPGWVVRVGTFARRDNVERVMKRLKQAGFEPSTTAVKDQKGSVTRVWIGPYAKRVEAARMRTRVKQVTGGDGYIAAYP